MRATNVLTFLSLFFSLSFLFAQNEDNDYRNSTEAQLKKVESSKTPRLAEILHQLFDPKVIQINFHLSSDTDASHHDQYSGTLYFTKGDFVILQDKKNESEYNYVTKGDKVYSWINGQERGQILHSTLDDRISFFLYFLDPSYIQRELYEMALTKDPKAKIIKAVGSTIVSTVLEDHDIELTFQENPLWFSQFKIMFWNQQSGYKEKYVVTVENPKTLREIPADAFKIPKEIRWEESKETLESRMPFL